MMPKRAVRTEQSAILEAANDGALLDTAPAVDAHPKEVNAVTNSSKSSPTAPPDHIEHDYAVGDRVRFECPGHDWHGETGTIVPPLKYVINHLHFVHTDNDALNSDFGYVAMNDRFLRRVTDPARTGEEAE